MKFSKNEKRLLGFLVTALIFSSALLLASAFYPGSHSIYLNKSASVYPTASAEFCVKCHPEKVANVSAGVHRNAGCLCHGYNPNSTALYNVNLAHNLTKNIYCTNCHSSYDLTSGDIIIHDSVSGINQSAHYIINSSGDKTPIYQHAKEFFNGTV